MNWNSTYRCICDLWLDEVCPIHNPPPEVPQQWDRNLYDPTQLAAQKEKHSDWVLKMLNRDRKEAKLLTDGVLQVDDTTFAVHKCIIGATSEYLEKLFSNKLEDKPDNVAKISGMTPERLERLLEYIYTGMADINSENVCATLEDAAYAQLIGLKKHCTDWMAARVTVDNCLLFRAYAKRHDAVEVIDEVDVKISDNVLAVTQHEDFKQLSLADVIAILKRHKHKITEKEILVCCEKWIKHQPETRKEHFTSLLDLVDFSYISSKFIREKVQLGGETVLYPEYNAKLLEELKVRKEEAEAEDADNFCQPNSKKKILVVGITKSWIMDTRSQEKQELPERYVSRWGATCLKDGNKLLVFGGAAESNFRSCPTRFVDDVVMLDLSRPIMWETVGKLAVGSDLMACAILNGNYFISGGRIRGGGIRSACHRFHPTIKEWVLHSQMLHGRYQHEMLMMNGSLYVLGGLGIVGLSSVERFSPVIGEWKSVCPMKYTRPNCGAAVLGNKIYAVGGEERGEVSSVETYWEESDQWTVIQPLTIRRIGPFVCTVNGKLFVVGGKVPGRGGRAGKPVDDVECYDPVTQRWSVTFRSRTPKFASVLAV